VLVTELIRIISGKIHMLMSHIIVLTAQELEDLLERVVSRTLDAYLSRQPTQPKLLKPAQAAKLLCISQTKLRMLRQSGQLAATKIGETVFYRYADIEAMYTAGTQRI